MNYLKNHSVKLNYIDYCRGQPVLFIHGWPLSHKSWEGQLQQFAESGFRVIAYDRRGFGESEAPWEDYDYSTLAGDLHALITGLNLKNVSLVGFSMGGGEVVRYLTDYGSEKIYKAALISSIIPLVPQKYDNPAGVPQKDLDEIMAALKNDRLRFLKGFHKNFYNYEENKNRMSEEQLAYDWSIASHASPVATRKAAESWAGTDFRDELKNVTVPTLIIHGDADQIVPVETSGDQAAEGIPDNEYHIIKDGPHGLNVTHKDQVNQLLLSFFKK